MRLASSAAAARHASFTVSGTGTSPKHLQYLQELCRCASYSAALCEGFQAVPGTGHAFTAVGSGHTGR